MRYASLKHDLTVNLGDEIQTIASDRFLPRTDIRLERDRLALSHPGEDHMLILNGWFSHSPESTFPLPSELHPVIIGMHITESARKHIGNKEIVDYLKSKGPVGCRDRGTKAFLESQGVPCYYSKCLTLTLPRRTTVPKNGKVFVVDIPRLPMPRRLLKHAEYITHRVESPGRNFDRAQALLDKYRDEAALVVTSRLHCALPCVAMGIPVIFFSNPDEYRVQVAADIGLRIHKMRPMTLSDRSKGTLRQLGLIKPWKVIRPLLVRACYRYVDKVNWSPEPIDFEEEKAAIVDQVRAHVARVETELDAYALP